MSNGTSNDLRRTRIKLCGLSKTEDVDTAVALGADAVGFVFYPPSARSVSVGQAVELAEHVPPLVSAVGLFVNATPDGATRRSMPTQCAKPPPA